MARKKEFTSIESQPNEKMFLNKKSLFIEQNNELVTFYPFKHKINA